MKIKVYRSKLLAVISIIIGVYFAISHLSEYRNNLTWYLYFILLMVIILTLIYEIIFPTIIVYNNTITINRIFRKSLKSENSKWRWELKNDEDIVLYNVENNVKLNFSKIGFQLKSWLLFKEYLMNNIDKK